MIAIIQEIASKSYTFREVAAYVTIAICMSFSIGFLLAAYTRIFKKEDASELQKMADTKVTIRHIYDDRPDEQKPGTIYDAYKARHIDIIVCDHRIPF